MASFNRWIIAGNVTADPELKEIGESSLASFSIAVNDPYSKTGEVMFVDCEFWNPGKVAGFISRGTPLLVEGRAAEARWEKDGQKRKKTFMKVQSVQLLGGARKEEREFV
jgi:single-strand DNA-binding protein